MHVLFLGNVKDKTSIPAEAREQIEHADIVFVPVQDKDGNALPKVHELAVSFNPNIIIPTQFTDKKDPALESFLKQAGGHDITEKLTIKKKDIDNRDGHVVVITS